MKMEIATQKFRGIKEPYCCNGEFRGEIQISVEKSWNSIWYVVCAECNVTSHHRGIIKDKLDRDTELSFTAPWGASRYGISTHDGIPRWSARSKCIKIGRLKKVLKNLKTSKYKVINEKTLMKMLTAADMI